MEHNRRSVAEVLRVCRERNVEATEPLAALVLNSVALVKGRDDLEQVDDAALGKIIDLCATRLGNKNSAVLSTLKMQVEMYKSHTQQKEQLDEAAGEKERRRERLLSTITKVKLSEIGNDAVGLYNKVLSYVEEHNGSADPSDEEKAETCAALESVFPLHGLSRFITLSLEEKAVQLSELASIVLGIRVYNSKSGIGGSIADASAEALQDAQDLDFRLKEVHGSASESIDMYRSLIEKISHDVEPETPSVIGLQDEMRYFQTIHHIVKELKTAASQCTQIISSLAAQYNSELDTLREYIGAHASVAKDKVYPHFDSLGAIHVALVDEREALRMHLEMIAELAAKLSPEFVSSLATHQRVQGVESASTTADADPEGKAPAERKRRHIISDAESDAVQSTAVTVYEEIPDGVKLACGGFCSYTFVEYGVLIPALPSSGCILYDGKHYGFTSSDARRAFAVHPDFVTAAVKRLVSKFPDAVMLMYLEATVPQLNVREAVRVSSAPLRCNFGTQTPTHFLERNVDYNYEWNVWSLRRKALQLANLRQKRTRAAQSVLSHFRQEKETQVWLPKSTAAQTKKDASQSMPRKLRYVQGLRGAPTVKMNVVNVSLDL